MNEMTSSKPPQSSPPPAKKVFAKKWIGVVAVVGGMGVLGLLRRGNLAGAAIDGNNVPTVAVTPVTRGTLGDALTLSAEFRPYQEVSVHAKVAGFVQSMSVDIGDHVKAGQALAVLEIPELKNDVQRAEAALQSSVQDVHNAEAHYEEAHLAYTRLVAVAKENPKLVAQQDLETAKAKDEEMKSGLESSRQHVVESQAEVDKMHTMLAYATITAPFAGVITKRYADTGALIQSGISSNTQAMPVVDLAEDDRLRLVFPVPESAVGIVKVGNPVTVSVDSLHKVFRGVIARYSGKVDTATRTMKAEVDVPNEGGNYTPGMYASVRMILEEKPGVLCVPLQTLALGPQPTAMVLSSTQQIEERKVTIGMQTATKAEISSGLHEGDLVIVGNRSGFHSGQKAVGKIIDLAEQ